MQPAIDLKIGTLLVKPVTSSSGKGCKDCWPDDIKTAWDYMAGGRVAGGRDC
jgi:formate-dependent phosphoribosylglycinamide formyltransferase (GAR transformylase)